MLIVYLALRMQCLKDSKSVEYFFKLLFIFTQHFESNRNQVSGEQSLRYVPNFLPAGNYMFKVNNRNTRTKCEIRTKLLKKPERHHWRRSVVFIINFVHISHVFLMFLLLTFSR